MAALYLALLTHYSALVFAATLAFYALVRLLRGGTRPKVTAIWVAGQAGAAAICVFLLHTQVSRLRATGLPSEIAQTWLQSSIFQPREDHLASFAWSKTVRLFRYFFSHGTIGFLGLALFLCALVVFFSAKSRNLPKTEQRSLALLLLVPFLLTLGASRAGIYPYGGTRHDVILALFAVSGVGLALDWLGAGFEVGRRWLPAILMAAALAIVHVFPSPTGPYIRPRNQSRKLMAEAIGFLKSLPGSPVLFTDHQGSFVLGYYLCGKTEPVPEFSGSLAFARCGDYRMVSVTTEEAFNRALFPRLLEDAWRRTPAETTLYTFESGWIDDKEQDWIAELRKLGGNPRNFGPNILICAMVKSKHYF
jgi:hypothetical protein